MCRGRQSAAEWKGPPATNLHSRLKEMLTHSKKFCKNDTSSQGSRVWEPTAALKGTQTSEDTGLSVCLRHLQAKWLRHEAHTSGDTVEPRRPPEAWRRAGPCSASAHAWPFPADSSSWGLASRSCFCLIPDFQPRVMTGSPAEDQREGGRVPQPHSAVLSSSSWLPPCRTRAVLSGCSLPFSLHSSAWLGYCPASFCLACLEEESAVG